MGLFEKKYCDVCGEKIKFLGNRKLEDGNLCKDCASKLSPWFSERRRSTVQDIKDQLVYREENQAKVRDFNTTRTVGEYYIVNLDEDHGKFCVTQGRDLRSGNPDILDFTQVTGCDLEIDESRSEVYDKDKEGNSVSFNPPRYDYSYDFYIHLRVNHPWFDEMKFRINRSSVDIDYGSAMPVGHTAPAKQGNSLSSKQGNSLPGKGNSLSGKGNSLSASRGSGLTNALNLAADSLGQTAFNPANYPEYQRYVAMGSEVKEAILQVRQEARDNMAAAAAPKSAVTCPHCGASTIPDASGCCEFCGGVVTR